MAALPAPPDPKGEPLSAVTPSKLESSPSNSEAGIQLVGSESPLGSGGAGRAAILIVEDNTDLREYLQFLLSGYNVLSAENGKVALELLKNAPVIENDNTRNPKIKNQNSPDLIISDLMMPVMDGFQFLEKLKSDDRWRHIPTIMLTAKVNVRAKLKALRIGVDDYLTKPFQEEELKARIENLLRNYQERMEIFAATKIEEGGTQESDKPIMAQVDAEWLEAVEALYTKYLGDSILDLNFVTEQLHISVRNFRRRLKKLTGLSPSLYLQEMRLHSARDYLLDGKYATIKEACYAVGFSDARYFSVLFQQRFGIKPSGLQK